MSSEIIPCPSCRHPVRVPDSLFGQAVRCPECKAYFTAPARDAAGALGEPVLLKEPPPRRPTRDRDEPIESVSAKSLLVPGLFLLLVGLTGSVVNGYQAAQWLIDKPAAEKDRLQRIEQVAKFTKREITEDQAKQIVEAQQPTEMIVALVSLLPILGGLSMLSMRFRWLAIVGSAAAIVNLGNCCCLIGLPAGIYSMIKLMDPQVRELFKRSV